MHTVRLDVGNSDLSFYHFHSLLYQAALLANAIATSLLSQDEKANRHWVVQIKRPNKQTSQINYMPQSVL